MGAPQRTPAFLWLLPPGLPPRPVKDHLPDEPPGCLDSAQSLQGFGDQENGGEVLGVETGTSTNQMTFVYWGQPPWISPCNSLKRCELSLSRKTPPTDDRNWWCVNQRIEVVGKTGFFPLPAHLPRTTNRTLGGRTLLLQGSPPSPPWRLSPGTSFLIILWEILSDTCC